MTVDEPLEQHIEPLYDSYPGEAASCAAAVAASLASITRLAQLPTNLTDAELTETARSLALVAQQAEATLVAITADAIDRGAVYRSTAADAKQWVRRLSTGEAAAALLGAETASAAGPLVPLDEPAAALVDGGDNSTDDTRDVLRSGLEPSHALRIAKLAEAARSPLNQLLTDAVVSGRVNTTIGRTCLDTVKPIAAVLPNATRGQLFEWLLSIGVGAGAKTIHELKKRILAEYGDEILDEKEDALQGVESLKWFDTPEGMVRFVADLSPDHAEQFKHAVQSLAAPSPKSDCCDDPHHRHNTGTTRDGDCDTPPAAEGPKGATGSKKSEPDPRDADKRRADALMLLLGLGAATVDSDGTIKHRGSARLIVTIDFHTLAGLLAGLGVTPDGTGITPDTVRQLACDAEITPMVLGSKGQPLDVGRRKRLVEDELRDAVIHRDKHCTYAGCDRPPVMCEVHHVESWWAGGETSLANSALLCSTHHRIVHRDKLTATVTDTGVSWHYAAAGAAA